jgi:hypothetical protein
VGASRGGRARQISVPLEFWKKSELKGRNYANFNTINQNYF